MYCTNVDKCLEEVVCSPCRQMFRGGGVKHSSRQTFRGDGVVHTSRQMFRGGVFTM